MNTGLVFKHLARKKKAYLCLLLLRELLYRLVDSMAWQRVEISEQNVYMRRVHRVKLAKNGSYFKQPPQRVRVMIPLWALLGGARVDIVDTSSQRDKLKAAGFQMEGLQAVFPGEATAYEPLPRMLWKSTDGIARDPNRYLLAEVGKLHARQARRFALSFLREDEK